jgi:outer membrane receptor for ferric coprogen and ferric-rhodotorulic acid
MALYDRVEVLRGASGLTTGAGDPSGIINMVRKKPTAAFQGSVEASVGSRGDGAPCSTCRAR